MGNALDIGCCDTSCGEEAYDGSTAPPMAHSDSVTPTLNATDDSLSGCDTCGPKISAAFYAVTPELCLAGPSLTRNDPILTVSVHEAHLIHSRLL